MPGFAETNIFESILKEDLNEAKRIAFELYPNEIRSLRKVLVTFDDILDEAEEKLEKEKINDY